MTRAVVIGLGDVSSVHLAAIAAMPDVELVGVCDTDPAAAAATGLPAELFHTDHRAMLAEVRPDVAHVCTPHDQHAPVAVDCIEAGVHVVLEKPLAHSVGEAERITAAAAAHPEVKVAVCFQNRYNRPSQEARRLLEEGTLGRSLGATATVMWHRTPAYYAAKPWRGQRRRSGGGVLINQAIHTLDLLRWLLGDVTSVGSRIGTHALADVIDVEDTAYLVLQHERGCSSVLFATVAHAVDAPVAIEITCERGTLRLCGDLTVTHADGRTEMVPERVAPGVGRSYWGVSHELLIADFHDRLAEQGPFWIGPAEGMAALRILDDVYRDDVSRP